MGTHVLSVAGIGLRRHLRVGHGDLVHLGCGGMRVGECWASIRLVWRVWEGGHRAPLVRAVELRAHVMTTTRLVRRLAEVRAW